MRTEQRDATREQIVQAALGAISESGYDGVSTRQIAARAGVTQGLLTYHFKSKDALWRAAADHLFAKIDAGLEDALAPLDASDEPAIRRETIRQMVRFGADHPETMRFMMEIGASDNRSKWLVETHLRRIYLRFCDTHQTVADKDLPHLFYILIGASMLMFSNSSKCRQLTGIDPTAPEAVNRHADLMIKLFAGE